MFNTVSPFGRSTAVEMVSLQDYTFAKIVLVPAGGTVLICFVRIVLLIIQPLSC